MTTIRRSLSLLLLACASAVTLFGVHACKKQGGGSSGRPDVMNGEMSADEMAAASGDGDARSGDWSGAVESVTYRTGAPTPSCSGAAVTNRVEANRSSFIYDRVNKTLSGRWACAPSVSFGLSEDDMTAIDATLLLSKFSKRGSEACDAGKVTGRWTVKRKGTGETAYVEEAAGCGADDVISSQQAFAESAWGRLEAAR
jgi:hypothetical protein